MSLILALGRVVLLLNLFASFSTAGTHDSLIALCNEVLGRSQANGEIAKTLGLSRAARVAAAQRTLRDMPARDRQSYFAVYFVSNGPSFRPTEFGRILDSLTVRQIRVIEDLGYVTTGTQQAYYTVVVQATPAQMGAYIDAIELSPNTQPGQFDFGALTRIEGRSPALRIASLQSTTEPSVTGLASLIREYTATKRFESEPDLTKLAVTLNDPYSGQHVALIPYALVSEIPGYPEVLRSAGYVESLEDTDLFKLVTEISLGNHPGVVLNTRLESGPRDPQWVMLSMERLTDIQRAYVTHAFDLRRAVETIARDSGAHEAIATLPGSVAVEPALAPAAPPADTSKPNAAVAEAKNDGPDEIPSRVVTFTVPADLARAGSQATQIQRSIYTEGFGTFRRTWTRYGQRRVVSHHPLDSETPGVLVTHEETPYIMALSVAFVRANSVDTIENFIRAAAGHPESWRLAASTRDGLSQYKRGGRLNIVQRHARGVFALESAKFLENVGTYGAVTVVQISHSEEDDLVFVSAVLDEATALGVAERRQAHLETSPYAPARRASGPAVPSAPSASSTPSAPPSVAAAKPAVATAVVVSAPPAVVAPPAIPQHPFTTVSPLNNRGMDPDGSKALFGAFVDRMRAGGVLRPEPEIQRLIAARTFVLPGAVGEIVGVTDPAIKRQFLSDLWTVLAQAAEGRLERRDYEQVRLQGGTGTVKAVTLGRSHYVALFKDLDGRICLIGVVTDTKIRSGDLIDGATMARRLDAIKSQGGVRYYTYDDWNRRP